MFLKNLLERRGLETSIGNASAYAKWVIDQVGGDTASGVKVSESTAEQLPVVFACINVLAQTLAHVPLELLKTSGKGSEKATKHPLYELLKLSPNGEQSSYQWRETLEGHRNGWGNAYSRIVRDGPYPVALVTEYPNATQPHRLQDGSIVYLTDNGDKNSSRIFAADMLHFAGRGFNGLVGHSPIAMAAETIGIGLAVHRFGAAFFGNGASPKGIIESEVPSNTLAPFVAEFKKNYGGLDQAHGTPILPKGLKYKPVSVNPDDAQTLETLKYNRTEICGIYRVPPQFVMDLERSTFTNAVEMDLHFVKHTMIPIFTSWEQELNRKLLSAADRRKGHFFKFNVQGLLRGATADRYAAYHIALQDGWMSRNEVRALEDMQEAEGLGEFLVPNNMIGDVIPDAQVVDVPAEEPLVASIAERMAANERKSTLRCAGDGAALGEFYERYNRFIQKTSLPTARMLQNDLDCTPEEFVERFAKRYIERQMNQTWSAELGIIVNEAVIAEVFYEVKNEFRT